MSDEPVAEAVILTSHSRQEETFMPSAGFEPAIRAIRRL